MPRTTLNIVRIDDLRDPRAADYANLRDRDLRARPTWARPAAPGAPPPLGLFIAEGELVVRRLIDSRFRTRSVLVGEGWLDAMRDALERLPAGTPVLVAPERVLDGIVGFRFHRGVLAAGEPVAPPALDDLLARAYLVPVLEDIANLDNAGSIFRNTAALAGRHGAVLLNERCCDPLYRKAVRVSMGHVLRVPYATIAPWPDALDRLKAAGFRILALTPRPTAADLADIPPAGPGRRLALLLGAEGPGLTAPALAAADQHVRIPIADGSDSLNVATACAIALHRLAPLLPE